jgi:hypothetical protein
MDTGENLILQIKSRNVADNHRYAVLNFSIILKYALRVILGLCVRHVIMQIHLDRKENSIAKHAILISPELFSFL